MGTIIKAKCQCGYESKEMFFGAGMEDFEKVSYVPSLKNGSSKIEMINHKRKDHFPEYSFYTDSLLSGKPTNSYNIDHFDLKLQQENNYCPVCENFNLQFLSLGCFD